MNGVNLWKPSCDQSSISPCCNNSWSTPREVFARYLFQNLAHKPTITKNRAGHHCFLRCLARGSQRFTESQSGEQRSSIVKKIRHSFQTRCNHSTNVIAAFRDDIEGHSSAEIDDNRRITIQFRHGSSVGEPIGSDSFWPRIINADAKIEIWIKKEHPQRTSRCC